VFQAALDEIDAEVTKAHEVLKTAGERTTLLVAEAGGTRMIVWSGRCHRTFESAKAFIAHP
jgi:hypothetical protein